MQHGIPDNYSHQGFHNSMSQKAFGRSWCAVNGKPSSNYQTWKAFPGSSYSANVPAPIYPSELTDQHVYPPNELSPYCSDSTFHPSSLKSALTGGSQSEMRQNSAYSRSWTTGGQPVGLQNRSMQSVPSSQQPTVKFVTCQNRPPAWNRDAHSRRFAPYQNHTASGMEPNSQIFPITRLRLPLRKHKMSPPSEQLSSWDNVRMPLRAAQVEHYWNKQEPNYQQKPIPGCFSQRANQQSSNVLSHHSEPFQNVNIGVYKKSIGPNMFGTHLQGEVLQRDYVTVPQETTQNHFMQLSLKEPNANVQKITAMGNKPYTQTPSPDGLGFASFLGVDAQSDNGATFQSHCSDYESTYRGQNISDTYPQKNPSFSRKRKGVDTMKFLSELSSSELKALIFAFEFMEGKKRAAKQQSQLAGALQTSAKLPPCQYIAQSTPCNGINGIAHRPVDSVNGYEDNSTLSVLRRLEKEKGAKWNGRNLQIACDNRLPLNTTPTSYSNFMDPNNVLSMGDYCTQNKNMNSSVVYPSQDSQQVLAPHVGNSKSFQPVKERSVPSLQDQKENSVCQNVAATSHSNNHCGVVGTDCILKSYLQASSSVNHDYLGSGQLNGRSYSMQPMNPRSAADPNQTDPAVLKPNASRHDEHGSKEIESLYNMLQYSYVNKANSHPKRLKMEAPSTNIRPSSTELDQARSRSVSAIQSSYGNQVAEYMHSKQSPYIKRNVSSSSAQSLSRAPGRQDAEVAHPLSEKLNIRQKHKESTPLNRSGDKRSLLRRLIDNSKDQFNNAVFPNLAAHKLPCHSTELSGGPQLPRTMDVAPTPQSIQIEQQVGEYPVANFTTASVDSHKFWALMSEESSRGQKAAINDVRFSNAGSKGQWGNASFPEDFLEQGFISPAPSLKLANGQSATSVSNTGHAELACKTSNGPSAENIVEKMSSASDIYAANDNNICNSSPESVVEELTSDSNSEEPLAKDSDTLEFILRSLGIIPEDSEAILTSLAPMAGENTVASFPANLSRAELRQNPDTYLPPFNMATQSKKQVPVASQDPFSTMWKVSTDASKVASFGTRERQYKCNLPADPLYNGNAAFMAGTSDGVNQLSSLQQPNIQVTSDQNAMVLNSAEHDFPSKATGVSDIETQLAVASVQVDTEAEENVPDNSSSAHMVATDMAQFEDVRLHDDSPPSNTAGCPLLSSPNSSSSMELAQPTQINTVPFQPVDLGSNYNGHCWRNCSGILSSSKMPIVTDCAASAVNIVRYKKYAVGRHFDSYKGLSKQINPIPRKEIVWSFETMGLSNSLAWESHENILPDSKDNVGSSSNSTQAAFASHTAGAEMLPVDDASNSADCIAINLPRAKKDTLHTRIRSQCTIPASGVPNSNSGLKPVGATVGQQVLEDGCLGQEKILSGSTVLAACRNPKPDLPSGIRITFVYSLSEYWERGTFINGKDTITGSLASTGQELQRCVRKVCHFSSRQMKQKAKVGNNKAIFLALMGTASNFGESQRRDDVTEMPRSQDTVPYTSNSHVHFGEPVSPVAKHSESRFHPEVNLGRIPVDDKYASETAASTNTSNVLPGNGHCDESPSEDFTNAVEKETSALCCLSSRETMNQDFFTKNKVSSAAEMEMSTESILHFWSPSKDDTEMDYPSQEPEKKIDFEHGIQRVYGGFGIYTAAGAAELNKRMHKLSALHQLNFGFTTGVNGSQVHREKSHLNRLYNQCNETKVIEVEGLSGELEPTLMDRAATSHLTTDEDNMGSWTDTALLKLLLESSSPTSCLQSSSDQMGSQLGNSLHGNNEAEAGQTKRIIPAMMLSERQNGVRDICELLSQGRAMTGLSTHRFRDEESLNECESSVDHFSEIRIKVLEHQELNNVLSEMSNSILNPQSEGAEESSEGQSPESYREATKNSDCRYLDTTRSKIMEISATECSSETSNSAMLSLSRVVSSMQH